MFRAGIENVSDALRGLSPGLVKQLLPIFDQLTPIYMDVAQVRGVIPWVGGWVGDRGWVGGWVGVLWYSKGKATRRDTEDTQIQG